LVITAKPDANAFGDALITVRISDKDPSDPKIGARAITLRVTSVNDVPSITSVITTTNVTAGGTIRDIPIRVVDVSEPPPMGETEAKKLTITWKSDNQAVLPDSNVVISQSGTNRLVTLTTVGSTPVPAPGVKLTLEVADEGGAKAQHDIFVVVDPREPEPGRTFVQTGEITVKDKASAEPYPSVITIPPAGQAALKGKVYKVEVVLDGVSHTAPDDLDVLLVAPNGNSIILMSDAGGRIAAVNSRLAFSDTATQSIRDDGPIPAEGTFLPSNYSGDVDAFPGADTSKLQTTLAAAFNGSNPNGDWKLYVVDDQTNDTGKFAKGWALRITTTPTITVAGGIPDPLVYSEDTVANPTALGGGAANSPDVYIEDADAGTSAAGLEITKKSSDESKIKAGNIALTGAVGAGGYDVAITPEKDQYDESTNLLTTITVTRKSDGASASATFKNVIRAVNDAPALTRTSNKIIQEDEVAETKFIVVDPPELVNNDPIELEAVSLDPGALTNIVLNGVAGGFGGASVKVNTTVGAENTIQVRPNKDAAAGGAATARIRITAKDSSTTAPAKLVSTPTDQFGLYTVTINPKNDAPTLAAIANQVITSGQKKVWDVAAGNLDPLIDVSDPDDNADIVVTATSSEQSLVKNTSIKVSPEKGGTGKRDLEITAELEKQGDTTITVTVTDKWGGTSSRSFVLSVRPSRERRFEGKNITINDLAVANPYPSIISVDSLVGDVSNVRVEINGLAHGYQYLCTMDADFSHSPESVPALLDKAASGYDLVIGSRYVPGGEVIGSPATRKFISYAANWLAHTTLGVTAHDCTAGFRCYRRTVLETIDLDSIFSSGYSFLIEMAFHCQRAGFRIGEVPITFVNRTEGASKINRGEIFKAFYTLLRLRTSALPWAQLEEAYNKRRTSA